MKFSNRTDQRCINTERATVSGDVYVTVGETVVVLTVDEARTLTQQLSDVVETREPEVHLSN